MCASEGIYLATDRLAYLAHCITPKIEKEDTQLGSLLLKSQADKKESMMDQRV